MRDWSGLSMFLATIGIGAAVCVLCIMLALIERRIQRQRMHRMRKPCQGIAFGNVEGPYFVRCQHCGVVEAGNTCRHGQ